MSRSPKSKPGFQKLNLDLKKNPEGSQIDQKSHNYFFGFSPRDSSFGSELVLNDTQSFSCVQR